jgi:hypothetical protein
MTKRLLRMLLSTTRLINKGPLLDERLNQEITQHNEIIQKVLKRLTLIIINK